MLVSLKSCQNGVLGVVFWVWGIARSHMEPNQANMVVVERYALSFWRNSHEERVQCETANYRDVKTRSCLPKISFETVLSDPLEMPIVWARSLIVNRGFLCTNSLIWLTCCSSVDVDGRPGHSESSTRFLPSLKSLLFLRKFLGNLSMFSIQFYVHFFMFFLHFSQYKSLLMKRAHMCNISFNVFIFWNKDHWRGHRLESKRFKVCNLLSYHFWTLKPIVNKNIV